ncbi:MAG: AzlD domain-containing protein [Pseudomonadota bacterium]
MNFSTFEIWWIIAILGIGTFLIRFSFIGMIGSRKMPDWVLRHLRYTSVAVLPGLVAPLVIWPDATNGVTDPSRLLAAATVVIVGYRFKAVVRAMVAGTVVLFAAQALLG